MKLRRFTTSGIEQFRNFLQQLRNDPHLGIPVALLHDATASEALSVDVEVEYHPFSTRLDLAKYLDQLLTNKGLENLEQDVGLWSWLTLFFLGQLCLRGKKPGKDHRYIPEITDFRVSYRHLLRSPYLILRAHADEPDCLACVLANKPDAPGDIYEQFASRQELITNKQLLNAMCKLYVKPNSNELKRNAPKSALRLVNVLSQFDLTYDLYSMPTEGLIALLPKEFKKFKPV